MSLAAWEWIVVIFGMAASTYPSRLIPLLFFNKRQVPERLAHWLSFLPVSIFSAVLMNTLLDLHHQPVQEQVIIIAAAIGAIVASFITRSMTWGFVTGLAVYILSFSWYHYLLPLIS